MLELNDHPALQLGASVTLHILSAVTPPPEYVQIILDTLLKEIKSSAVNSKFVDSRTDIV
jgi:proteasome activator subunit 4